LFSAEQSCNSLITHVSKRFALEKRVFERRSALQRAPCDVVPLVYVCVLVDSITRVRAAFKRRNARFLGVVRGIPADTRAQPLAGAVKLQKGSATLCTHEVALRAARSRVARGRARGRVVNGARGRGRATARVGRRANEREQRRRAGADQ
jgi:hypothetical protein